MSDLSSDDDAGLPQAMEARALQSLFIQLTRRAARLRAATGFHGAPPALSAEDGTPLHFDELDLPEGGAAALLKNAAMRALEQRLDWLADGLHRIYGVDKADLFAAAEAAIGARPRLDDRPRPDRQLEAAPDEPPPPEGAAAGEGA